MTGPFTTSGGEAYNPAMRRILAAGTALLLGVTLSAQDPVIKRGAPVTLTGELVDISCYKQKGVAGGTGAGSLTIHALGSFSTPFSTP